MMPVCVCTYSCRYAYVDVDVVALWRCGIACVTGCIGGIGKSVS